MPREPAYADERSQDGEAKSASECVKAWRACTNVRLSRRGRRLAGALVYADSTS
jgi:hypothetical protein